MIIRSEMSANGEPESMYSFDETGEEQESCNEIVQQAESGDGDVITDELGIDDPVSFLNIIINITNISVGAVHKVCHAPEGGGGLRKCDSL